jgi:glucan 1,3-beta-glucosidase
MDSWSLCEALGPVRGKELIDAHFASWFTKEDIKDLAIKGVKMVRLPIGDWTLKPYGPYIGCMDSSEKYIQWMFDTCAEYGIQILLDVHGVKGSQNGYDNSGHMPVNWIDETHFSHWPNIHADWLGTWVNGHMDHADY